MIRPEGYRKALRLMNTAEKFKLPVFPFVDTPGAYPWGALRAALGPQRPVPPGLLPHWSRFVALEGIDRQGRDRGRRWIGAAA